MTLAQFINAKNTLSGTELTAWLLRGNDTISGSAASDRLFAWNGNDILNGNGGNDRLNGGFGADTLRGGAGNDTLTGGNAKDRMGGGSGMDIFDFNSTAESGPYSGSRDVITDFTRGQDKIDLSGIDANTQAAGNSAFTKVIGNSASFTAPGQLKVSGGVLYINTDGDAAAEFSVQLSGITQLSLGDFIL
jgi:serralysin